jgi:5-methylcytosine-specific restriction endonuclease McrA
MRKRAPGHLYWGFIMGGHRRWLDEEIYVENSKFQRGHLKKRILESGLIPYECLECGLKGEWNCKKLVLRLDHINGVNNDHRDNNLRFLCPNCDSQQPTYAGRNVKRNGAKV